MKKDKNLNLEEIESECQLNDGDPEVVISKIENFKKVYSKFQLIDIYNYLLKSSVSPEVMLYLINCINSYRNESSLEVLLEVLLLKNDITEGTLSEKYVNVKVACVKAIANLKDKNAISALLYCLNNKAEHYRVRLACAEALGRIGDKYAVAPLINVVKDQNEKSVYLKESAVTALGMLGDIRAIAPLTSILETKNGLVDKFSFMKERIIEALDKMGFSDDERVYKAIKNSLLDESPQVRISAIEALMDSEHPKAFETIKQCLINDTDEEVKKNALIALYNLSDRSILDEVINSCQYSDKLKMAAVEIIDEYEG